MRPDPRLVAAARLVENLATKLPLAREHVRAQINAIDGWTPGNDSPRVQATAELTGPEAMAEARLALQARLTELEGFAAGIAHTTANALRDCDHLIGMRLTKQPVPQCNATGRDGYLMPRPPQGDGWSTLDCANVATRGPLCDACSKREYRWRLRHGLPPRQDGVFAGDLEPSR